MGPDTSGTRTGTAATARGGRPCGTCPANTPSWTPGAPNFSLKTDKISNLNHFPRMGLLFDMKFCNNYPQIVKGGGTSRTRGVK